MIILLYMEESSINILQIIYFLLKKSQEKVIQVWNDKAKWMV